MPLIEWRPAWDIGIPAVDYEHRQMVQSINDIYDRLGAGSGGKAAVAAFLAELHDGTAAHFALEERMMREQRYPAYPEHKDDHERLLDQIRDIMEAQEAGGFEDVPQFLADQLDVWFSRHFHTHDMRWHRAHSR